MAELTGYEAAVQMADAGAEPEGPGEAERPGKAGGGREAEKTGEAEGVGETEGSGEAGEVGGASEAGEAERLHGDEALWVGDGERRGFREGEGAWSGAASRLGVGGLVGAPDEEPPEDPGDSGGEGAQEDPEDPEDSEGRGEAVAVVPVVVGPVRSRMFGPRLVPPPLRPDRVYEGWVPVAARSGVRRAEEGPGEIGRPSGPREIGGTDDAGEPDAVVPIKTRPQAPRGPRKVAMPPSVAPESPVERTSPSVPPEPRDGCPGEWRGTWLWEVCKKHARQEV
ncbi:MULTISPECIES: hypothetical protein [unclassified Streptosporangium]|uniref:hypothetical protein n=1 Tax=unclassified Streptosporangium TaxID=2632669 RepID=UPI002E289E02|nr:MULTISPECIES: hypothetical protein [unclassified Streptosporangium]